MSFLIEFDNVEKNYNLGSVEYKALQGISFGINKGEMVSIIGQSGSGKSTILNILGALDYPTKGRYLLNGKDISTLNEDELAIFRNKEIGFIFQSFNLLPKTSVLENVMLPLLYRKMSNKERLSRSLSVIKEVGLESKVKNLSNQLSGGQIQRVAIARALVTDPAIILADEPTGSLDSKNSVEVMDLLSNLNKKQNKTIILITHNPELSLYGSRIIEVKDGTIINDKNN
jgi:putative ABC transport system ATP-binding protein